jgi:hypothetical protein
LPPTAGLGIGIVNAGVEKIEGRDASGHPTGTLSAEEYALYISFANELVPGLSLGVNVKMFYQILPVDGTETVNGKGIGVDAGILYRQSKNFEMGLVLQDWNAAYAWNTGEVFEDKGSTYQDPFPLQVRAGFVYRPGFFDMIGDYTYFRMGEHVSEVSIITNHVKESRPVDKTGAYLQRKRILISTSLIFKNLSRVPGIGSIPVLEHQPHLKILGLPV